MLRDEKTEVQGSIFCNQSIVGISANWQEKRWLLFSGQVQCHSITKALIKTLNASIKILSSEELVKRIKKHIKEWACLIKSTVLKCD